MAHSADARRADAGHIERRVPARAQVGLVPVLATAAVPVACSRDNFPELVAATSSRSLSRASLSTARPSSSSAAAPHHERRWPVGRQLGDGGRSRVEPAHQRGEVHASPVPSQPAHRPRAVDASISVNRKVTTPEGHSLGRERGPAILCAVGFRGNGDPTLLKGGNQGRSSFGLDCRDGVSGRSVAARQLPSPRL
jgi:hypothetical protein